MIVKIGSWINSLTDKSKVNSSLVSALAIGNLHMLTKYIKELKVQIIPELPHYANYGLFFKNNEITTGIMNNAIEMKINLMTGYFSYYNANDESATIIKVHSPEIANKFHDFCNSAGMKIPEIELVQVHQDEMKKFLEYAKQPIRLLESVRDSLSGNHSQVYLWGHNFDFDLVLYYKADSQIDIGISPGDGGHPNPYVYLTPRPFNPEITRQTLKIGRWMTESWNGILVEWNEMSSMSFDDQFNHILELIDIAKSNFN